MKEKRTDMTRLEANTIALSLVDKYDDEKDFLIAQLDYRGHLWDLILTKQGALTHPFESTKVHFVPYCNDPFVLGCITRVWITHDYRIANQILNEGMDLLPEDEKFKVLPLYNAENVNESIKQKEKQEKNNDINEGIINYDEIEEKKNKSEEIMSKYGLV